VSEVKVDRSFVLNMEEDEDDATIVRSTIDLARNLGLDVVAEGVETRTVWDRLKALGCTAAQGYYLSRPIPPAELRDWVLQRRRERDGGAGVRRPAELPCPDPGAVRAARPPHVERRALDTSRS
jgi:predicted signal transduction protein with EAL and GGDEF domain